MREKKNVDVEGKCNFAQSILEAFSFIGSNIIIQSAGKAQQHFLRSKDCYRCSFDMWGASACRVWSKYHKGVQPKLYLFCDFDILISNTPAPVQLVLQTPAFVSNTRALQGQRVLHWAKFVSTASSHNCCGSQCLLSLSSLLYPSSSLVSLHYAAKKHMAMCWHSNYLHFHPHLLFSLPAFLVRFDLYAIQHWDVTSDF